MKMKKVIALVMPLTLCLSTFNSVNAVSKYNSENTKRQYSIISTKEDAMPMAGVRDVFKTYSTYQGKRVWYKGTKRVGNKIYYLEGYLNHYKTDSKGFHYYGSGLKIT